MPKSLSILNWAEKTVRQTIHRWQTKGLVGLWDTSGRGVKPKSQEADLVHLEQSLEQEQRTYNSRQLAEKRRSAAAKRSALRFYSRYRNAVAVSSYQPASVQMPTCPAFGLMNRQDGIRRSRFGVTLKPITDFSPTVGKYLGAIAFKNSLVNNPVIGDESEQERLLVSSRSLTHYRKFTGGKFVGWVT